MMAATPVRQGSIGGSTIGRATFMPGLQSAQFNGGVFTNIGRDNITVVQNHYGPSVAVDLAAILELLPLPNFRKIQIDTYGQATDGTCLHIVDGQVFQVWMEKGKILWGIGMPGAGKTVLASAPPSLTPITFY
ncbi:hypothetical protein BKA70DRAFT_511977 [Coprinopsis sp. MPI-PUGE-AT-0042]|nr:hypothetical protein BKA70DRAFT_511977 [Coprinopsis sp. MPI-PUGE-AT-0042]